MSTFRFNAAEYSSLTAQAGFVSSLARSRIELTGPDSAPFLHNFCTNEVKKLPVGEACEAFICNVKGHTIGHAQIYREAEERITLDMPPGQAEAIIAHLDRYLMREKVSLRNASDDRVIGLIAGAEAASLLLERFGVPLPDSTLGHGTAMLDPAPCVIRRTALFGPSAWTLEYSASDAPAVEAAILSIGFAPCGEAMLECLRIEAGYPLFGLDFTSENLPQELARDSSAISFNKGCYLGQETVARIDALGHVNRLLATIKWQNEAIPPHDTAIHSGDREIGRVTSSCFSPRFGGAISLALVRRGSHVPGTAVSSTLGAGVVLQRS